MTMTKIYLINITGTIYCTDNRISTTMITTTNNRTKVRMTINLKVIITTTNPHMYRTMAMRLPTILTTMTMGKQLMIMKMTTKSMTASIMMIRLLTIMDIILSKRNGIAMKKRLRILRLMTNMNFQIDLTVKAIINNSYNFYEVSLYRELFENET